MTSPGQARLVPPVAAAAGSVATWTGWRLGEHRSAAVGDASYYRNKSFCSKLFTFTIAAVFLAVSVTRRLRLTHIVTPPPPPAGRCRPSPAPLLQVETAARLADRCHK